MAASGRVVVARGPGEGRGRCRSVGTVSALEVKTSRDPLHSSVSTVDTAELHT